MKKINMNFAIILSIIFLLLACSNDEDTNESASNSEGGATIDTLDGYWEGEILIPDQPLPIILEFENESGAISIPVQGLQDYPLSRIELKESELLFDMDLQGQEISFAGQLKQEQISGTFTQQEQTFPFELIKGSKEEAEVEDSELEEVVQVKGGAMEGKVEMPEGDGPFPVSIIIAGSGPTDKDGNSAAMPGKNNGLKMLAEDLASQGIASIRYDKRGVGTNMTLVSSEEDLRFEDYIGDAAAWIEHAKGSDLFSSVSVIGHSEGSLIGMAAAYKADAEAFISLAGAGRPVDEVLLEQVEAQLPSHLFEESTDILEQLKQGERVQDISPELESVFRSSVQPYMISWLKYNPKEELEKLDIPVLIINGTRDIQVPVADAERLHEVDQSSELLIIDDMNHVLKDAPADQEGNMATYSDPNLPLTDGLVDDIAEFLKN
ncbi:alpha/beta hydrolase [Salipaludibacillus sp. HK11]|uniref:alpha/beta hydrolase n=1 Tax=Salipaludibacillus sp. HK11 TaxID=3394320 RepID=UPI0039FBDC4A